MTDLFNKLPGFVRTPPGKERVILRYLPRALLIGSLLIALPTLLVRLLQLFGVAALEGKTVSTIDIYGISVIILWWTALFTIAIGAFFVLVMKGPAYVADPYPLVDIKSPDRAGRHGK